MIRMKYIGIVVMALLLLSTDLVSAKKKKSEDKIELTTKGLKVYAFGFAASFNDSIVYCTDIQVLDSAVVGKYNALEKRSSYSAQLKDYVEYTIGKPNYTTMIMYDVNQKKLLTRHEKLVNNYAKGNMHLVAIKGESFKFTKPEE